MILLYPVKKIVSSELGEKYTQIKHHLQDKTTQTVINEYVIAFLMREDNRGINFFTVGSVIMDYGLLTRRDSLKLKHLNDRFVRFTRH